MYTYSFALEVTDAAELGGGEVPEVTGAVAPEDVNDVSLKVDGGLGVDKVEGSGGAPAADPVEGALEGGGPGGNKDGKDVALRGKGLDTVVLGVVGHDFLDDVKELVVVVRSCGGSGTSGELVDEVVKLLKPRLVEAGEAAHCGSGAFSLLVYDR